MTTRTRESRRLTGDVPTKKRPARDETALPDPLPKWFILERQKWVASEAAKDRRIHELEMSIVNQKQAERHAAETQQQTALALYGDKALLSDLKSRMMLDPRFKDLDQKAAAAVVQVAHATGLNPFMHIHAWIDKRGNLNITPDYKGLLHLANQDNIMSEHRFLTADEMRARGIAQIDIDNGAIACVTTVTEIDKAIRCKQGGIDYKPVEGYAVWYPKQTKYTRDGKPYEVTDEPPNGRDGAWVAQKNSLRAALYQISNLALKLASPVEGAEIVDDGWRVSLENGDGDVSVIEGAFTETPDRPDPALEQTALFEGAIHNQGRDFARCEVCNGEGAEETPVGFMCASCANDTANEQASK